jgi:PTS system mannose-specific IIA component
MKDNLVGALLVTHGDLGRELLAVADKIVGGGTGHLAAVSIGWHDDVEDSKQKIQESLKDLDTGSGVIILTDMFGGTPSNISMPLLEKGKVEIVTGVNLPMVVKLASQTGDDSPDELAMKIRDQGKRQISVASELLGE